MKKIYLTNLLIAILLTITYSVNASNFKTPSFPGAQGFGMYVTGGRGGVVYHVTTLEDTGASGSFRYACNQSGVRTIVFDVSGTIHLTSQLNLENGNVTIAGQTAPGDGICIAEWPFVIKTPNVIIRYMRFRCGNKYVSKTEGDGGHEGDGLGGFDGSNIIIDHCSVSWSIDECLAIYGNRNTTVQWCMSYQSLRNAGHQKGAHGYGAMMGGGRTTYHHNLIADHDSRTPRYVFRSGDDTSLEHPTDYRNNVIYNWGGNGAYGGEEMEINIVNNYYKPGALTNLRSDNVQKRILGTSHGTHYESDGTTVKEYVWGHYFVDGNYNTKWTDVSGDNWYYGVRTQVPDTESEYGWNRTTMDSIKLVEAMPFALVTTHTAEQSYNKVLAYAGASLHRDALDKIIASDVMNSVNTFTGAGESDRPGIIDTQDDAKTDGDDAWPKLTGTTVSKDTDGDGMPDVWETANGLNYNDASDGNTVGSDGYTNLENYINYLVSDITNAQLADGTIEGLDIATTGPLTSSVIDASNAISLPYTEYFDLNKATHNGGTIKIVESGDDAGVESIDDVRSGQYWTFVLNNNVSQAYTVSFRGATARDDVSLNFSIVNSYEDSELNKDVTITKTNWATFNDYSFSTDVLDTGLKYFIITFNNPSNKYTVNINKIKFTSIGSTGINDTVNDIMSDNSIYTLDGRIVGTQKNLLQKGVYITKKKKIVIK